MINKAILVGRLAAEPELRATQSGVYVCSFTVAVDRKYSSGGKRQADFIGCVAWRQAAEFVSRYFCKGHWIGVDGAIQTRGYEDKHGNKRTAVEVAVDSVSFVGSKADSGGKAPSAPPPAGQGTACQSGGFGDYEEITSDEDLPF